MKRTYIVTIVVALVFAAPAFAQPRPIPDDPAKPRVETFEIVLRNAVDAGGRKFAQEASKKVPVVLEPGDSAVVSGVVVHEIGAYFFRVQVPLLLQTSLVLNEMMSRPAPVRDVNQSGDRVASTIDPDPTASSPAVSTFDPDREYTSQVSESLVDAVLDSWAVLPITATETLIIVAGGADDAMANAVIRRGDQNSLYRTTPKELVLTAKGSDLLDFRLGKISRDEARQRITRAYF